MVGKRHDNPWRSERARRRAAFTLVELLVTMSIMAILMMAGVGLYWRMNRGFAVQAATSSIESALRAARACAIHEHSPAVVVAQPQSDNPGLVGLIYALGRQTVSGWHFEASQFGGDKLHGLGALGQVGTLPVAATFAPGRVGDALALNGTSTRVQVTSPYLDSLREGVFVEAYVFPETGGGNTLPIVSKGNFSLSLVRSTGDFALNASVQVEGSTTALPAATDYVVRPGEWTHVAMAYYRDGTNASGAAQGVFELRVNGEVMYSPPSPLTGGTMLLAANASALQIGTDGTNYFKGRLDELKIAGPLAGEVYKLPKNTEVTLTADGVAANWDGRIHFDAEGRLDTRYHTGSVLFRITSSTDNLYRFVRVNCLGSIEVFQQTPSSE